jgi:hypothetical protein
VSEPRQRRHAPVQFDFVVLRRFSGTRQQDDCIRDIGTTAVSEPDAADRTSTFVTVGRAAARPKYLGRAAARPYQKSTPALERAPGFFICRSSKQRIRRPLERMEAASLIQRHFVRLLFIHLEQSRLLGGEVAIQDVEIGFVVQLDRSVIEIS